MPAQAGIQYAAAFRVLSRTPAMTGSPPPRGRRLNVANMFDDSHWRWLTTSLLTEMDRGHTLTDM